MKHDFSNLKVMVIGEVGLDVFEYGTSTRTSPEADVPVILINEKKSYVGMAGNLADQLTELGAEVKLYTVLGDQDNTNSGIFKRLKTKITYVIDYPYLTPRKTRIFNSWKQVARIDKETTIPLSAEGDKNFLELVIPDIHKSDAVFIQDYGKGLWSQPSLQSVIQTATQLRIPVFIDPDPRRHLSHYQGYTLLKPNLAEAKALCGMVSGETKPEVIAKTLGAVTTSTVVVTLGASGAMVSIAGRGESKHLPTRSVRSLDVTGAGDTFMAVMGLVYLKTEDLYEAVAAANKAAGIVVQKPGTAHVTLEEFNG